MNSTISEQAKQVAKQLGKIDRHISNSRVFSLMQKASSRANVLDLDEATRDACYSLVWAFSTGRFGCEQAQALMALSMPRFVQAALDISAIRSGVSDQKDAWKAALAAS